MSIFQNALPVRFAGKLRPDGFDDFRMIEKREKGSRGARRDIAQRKARRGFCAACTRIGAHRSRGRGSGGREGQNTCKIIRRGAQTVFTVANGIERLLRVLDMARPACIFFPNSAPAHICARSARSHHSRAASGNSVKSSSIGASQYQRSSVPVVASCAISSFSSAPLMRAMNCERTSAAVIRALRANVRGSQSRPNVRHG